MAIPVVDQIFDIGRALIEKLIPDPKAKAEALFRMEELRQQGDLAIIAGQVEINKIEASNRLTFVSGWRPFVGWVCAAALGCQLVVFPLAVWVLGVTGHPMKFPELDTSLLTTLLVGMLGLGGMRTVEKLQGVASK